MTSPGKYQKQLVKEMNEYAEATGMDERFTLDYVASKYTEPMAREIITEHYLPLMLSDFRSEQRKKKSTKSKSKRKKGCGCK